MGNLLVIKGSDFSTVAVDVVTPIASKITITVLSSPTGGGTVTGSGRYEQGDIVQITAVANIGFRFVSWNDGNTNATRNITVGETSTTYVATFAAITRQYVYSNQDIATIVSNATGSAHGNSLDTWSADANDMQITQANGVRHYCTADGIYKAYRVVDNEATLIGSVQADGTQDYVEISFEKVSIGTEVGAMIVVKNENATNSGVSCKYMVVAAPYHCIKCTFQHETGGNTETVAKSPGGASIASFPFLEE